MFDGIHAKVTSQTRGRARIRAALLKSVDPTQLTERLTAVNGVIDIVANFKVGSILVSYQPGIFDETAFIEVFNSLLSDLVIEPPTLKTREERKAEKPLPVAQVKERTLYKRLRKIENRSMLITGAACLAGLFVRGFGLHVIGGSAFAVAAAAHSWRYRKTIW